MYIWDVRRKINPLLLGFRNVFIKKILNHDIIDPVLKMVAEIWPPRHAMVKERGIMEKNIVHST